MSRSFALIARSIVFNVLFYANMIVLMLAALPTIVLPYPFLRAVLRFYARSSLWLVRVICGVRVEWRNHSAGAVGIFQISFRQLRMRLVSLAADAGNNRVSDARSPH